MKSKKNVQRHVLLAAFLLTNIPWAYQIATNSISELRIQYRDTNKRAGKLIRQRVNLTSDYQIYFCEIDLKTNEIGLNQEKISYSVGKPTFYK